MLFYAEASRVLGEVDRLQAATVQKLCYGYAAASSRYARRDLRCVFTELLHGVNGCLILDQFGELITCPIQEGDGAGLLAIITGACFPCLIIVMRE